MRSKLIATDLTVVVGEETEGGVACACRMFPVDSM